MSQFADRAAVSICGGIRNVPLLELLVEYMDANKCIEELLKQLEEERRNVRREKLAVARLQREVARSKSEGTMREKLIHELEEERRLRLDSEKRLREVTEESELGRVQMVLLQQHFSRMEETVRSLLQNQGAVDTMDIMKAYKDKLSEEAHKQHDGPEEERCPPPAPADPPSSDPGSVPSAETDGGQSEEEKTEYLLERLKALEDQNSNLASENASQREQYERCLDEVANQVVQALLTQKDLREECLKLRTRVFDLEQQNRTMSILFQQRVKPASDLLLQKLHSRIMDLSAADLLLEPERSKGGLLSKNADPPSHEVQPNGKAYLPAKCLSQSSLSAPAPVYPRSSCSSSELSLSSACSEYSSGSYTWNDGRSCGKMSSLTWEKRLSLGSSAPSNICAPAEEQLPTRRAKESHILEGLRKLQRRKHRSSSASSRVSKSGEKDCMNSNEGIYSLGIKSSSKGVCKPPYVGRTVALGLGVKRFSYDSDDADDESAHAAGQRDSVPCRDSWSSCQTKLSRSISDSLCSWEGLQDNAAEGDVSTGGADDAKRPPAYDSKERPERLMCFISSFLSGGVGGRPSAFSKPTKLHHVRPADPEVPLHSSDPEDPVEPAFESGDACPSVCHVAEHPDKEAKRPSRDPTKLLMHQCLRRDHGRTQSADGRPRPFSLIREPRGASSIRGSPQFAKSEESLLAIFDAEGQPIELSTQTLSTGAGPRNDITNSKAVVDYTQLVSQERPTRQKGGNGRKYSVLESPEKPSEYQSKPSKANKASNSNEGCTERLAHLTPQKKLIKPLSTRANKGHPIPPISDSTTSKSNSSKIPGRNKPTASPLRVSKGSSTEPGNTVNLSQEKSPSSPPVKLSRYIKPSGGSCVQSPKAVNAKLPSRSDWSKCGTSGSPQTSRRHLEHVDNGTEQPTRDEHCETSKNKLRSPSPPLPPGRTTSLLIRPNYEGSPQAHKTGVAQTSAPTTVRGPPPSYHPPPVPNMQATLPIKGHDSVDFDAGYGTALAPQKLVDKTGQHLPKSPAVTHTPSKGTYKRTPVKHYLSSATSGCPPESEHAPKGSKHGPPPYGAQRGTSLQGSFVSKRGSVHEHGIQPTHKTSTGLPVSLQDQPLCNIEPQDSKLVTQQAVASLPTSAVMSPNAVEKTSKTRIPMGFKAFLKSPPAHKSSQSVPGKHEKDHINSVSKETVTFNASTQCDTLQPEYSIDSSPKTSITEGKGDVQGRSLEGEAHSAVLLEEGGEVCDKGKRGSQLFSRSISVTTKPHLKPALGMNGAKARSQSFSTNYMEKPNVSVPDGPGKIRTQIITNSGERGNSLSRQSSMEVPSVAPVESPVHCSRNRLSLYGGLTGSNSHGILPDRTSKSGPKVEWSQSTMKGEVTPPQPRKEARSLPITDRIGLKNSRKPAKVTSYPQFQSPSSHGYDPNATLVLTDVVTSPSKPDVSWVIKAQTASSNELPDTEEKKVLSPTACTIEEKVMMGIEENLQKCQEQEKVTAAETKQKTGPSLANWFGLRKSKLPALNAKKTDSPKGKDEKKELKIGSVLVGKQAKSDKKKDKKKNDNQCKDSHEEQNLTETNNKLSCIMDQCNIQMGQIANQIQCTTAYFGKDQFMKEFLGRTAVKGDSLGPSLAAISVPMRAAEMRGDMEICTDTATIIMTQKINPRAENEEALVPDPTHQDHMIGSGCQMRTLDSGIGTFPLPDSVSRAGGGSRGHVPKSESSPSRISGVIPSGGGEPGGQEVLSSSSSLAASSPPHRQQQQHQLHHPTATDVKVPSLLPKSRLPCLPGALGHSLSDPAVALSSQSRLPKPTATDVIRSKRLSQSEPRGTNSSSMEAQEKAIERTAKTKDHDLSRDRTLRVCTYPGSSSDSDTEAESSESTLGSPQKTLIHQPKKSSSVDHNEEETLKRSSVEKPLSIMDYYQHDMFSHMEKDSRRISQYNLLHKESPLDGKAGDRLSKEIPLEKTSDGGNVQPTRGSLSISLESLNQLNHGGSGSGSGGGGSSGGGPLYPDAGGHPAGGRRGGGHHHHGVTRMTSVGDDDDSCGRAGEEEEPQLPPSSSSPSFSCKPGADPSAGSLSDSLYDSFSSCTSQGSNDV